MNHHFQPTLHFFRSYSYRSFGVLGLKNPFIVHGLLGVQGQSMYVLSQMIVTNLLNHDN